MEIGLSDNETLKNKNINITNNLNYGTYHYVKYSNPLKFKTFRSRIDHFTSKKCKCANPLIYLKLKFNFVLKDKYDYKR